MTAKSAVNTPSLSSFIRENTERILAEWETFARSLPAGEDMDVEALRDHAREMLVVIADDLDQPQSRQAQSLKSQGGSDATEHQLATAAQEHGTGRAGSGFSIEHMVAEFRALRASVKRLWCEQRGDFTSTDLQDIIRFDEAIDQAIAESVARFSQAVRLTQERFLAILGHDLRTPLGAIMTSTQFMLETGELEEPNRTLVARLGTSARRMNQLVLDLLEFTRTRLGDAIPIVRRTTDARRLVHDVVLEIAASYPTSTVQVQTSGDLHGEWDADRLTQAVTNLVSNAVQHGAPGAPITVAAQGLDGEVVISVHNEGAAIPPDQVKRIFEAGIRGFESSRDRRHLGLGLYIVDKIVTAHAGTISVQSSPEEGTTFTIRLPRGASETDPAEDQLLLPRARRTDREARAQKAR